MKMRQIFGAVVLWAVLAPGSSAVAQSEVQWVDGGQRLGSALQVVMVPGSEGSPQRIVTTGHQTLGVWRVGEGGALVHESTTLVGQGLLGSLDANGDGEMDVFAGDGVYLWQAEQGVYEFNDRLSDEQAQLGIAGDFDGDGDEDIILAQGFASGQGLERWLWLGSGDGGFEVGDGAPRWEALADLQAIDVEGDGQMEWVTLDYEGRLRVWRLEDGAAAPLTDSVLVEGSSMRVGDVDGDGQADVFVAGATGQGAPTGFVALWTGDGEGGFVRQGLFEAEERAAGASVEALRDVDGDGDLDALLITIGAPLPDSPEAFSAGAIHVWLNDGQGTLEGLGQEVSQGTAFGTAVGDLDGDGTADFIAGGLNSGRVFLSGTEAWALSPMAPSPHAGPIAPETDFVLTFGPEVDEGELIEGLSVASAVRGPLGFEVVSDGQGAVTIAVAEPLLPGDKVTVGLRGAFPSLGAGITRRIVEVGGLWRAWSFDVAVGAQTTPWFEPYEGESWSAGTVLAADMDRDGLPEVWTVDRGSVGRHQWGADGVLEVSDAGFGADVLLPGDFDGDGLVDMGTARDGGPFEVHLGRPDGALEPEGVAWGDVGRFDHIMAINTNFDPRTDLMTWDRGIAARLTNTATEEGVRWDGSAVAVAFDNGPALTGRAAVGDLNGDGLPDAAFTSDQGLVLAEDFGGNWADLFGRRLASFPEADAVAIGDMDGDGWDDLCVVAGGAVEVWFVGPDLALEPGPDFGGVFVQDVDLGDVDGDGDLDALISQGSRDSELWLNDGTGNMTHLESVELGASGQSRGIFVDVDGDGALDVALPEGGLWLQRTAPPMEPEEEDDEPTVNPLEPEDEDELEIIPLKRKDDGCAQAGGSGGSSTSLWWLLALLGLAVRRR